MSGGLLPFYLNGPELRQCLSVNSVLLPFYFKTAQLLPHPHPMVWCVCPVQSARALVFLRPLLSKYYAATVDRQWPVRVEFCILYLRQPRIKWAAWDPQNEGHNLKKQRYMARSKNEARVEFQIAIQSLNKD